jgi:hypothetical protein
MWRKGGVSCADDKERETEGGRGGGGREGGREGGRWRGYGDHNPEKRCMHLRAGIGAQRGGINLMFTQIRQLCSLAESFPTAR